VAKMFDHVLCFLSQSEIGDFDAIILSRKLRFIRFKINKSFSILVRFSLDPSSYRSSFGLETLESY
jgi:hypothetical protein